MPFNKNIYDINWNKLARWITPFKWRKLDYLALLQTFFIPVNSVHSQFLFFKNYIDYRLSITPQTVYLEKLLNDQFDGELRRIEIVKGIAYDAVPLWLKVELKPQKFHKRKRENKKLIFYQKSETEMFTVDFIVRVPILVNFDMNELIAYLDIDVLPSKVYKVQIV